MSTPSTKLDLTNKGNKLAKYNVARFNELMRIAKSDEYMSEAEFNELTAIFKIRGYH